MPKSPFQAGAISKLLLDRRLNSIQWLTALLSALTCCLQTSTLQANLDEEDDAVAAAAGVRYVLTEQQFDQMVFGGQPGQVAVAPVVNGNRQVEFISQSNSNAESAFRTRMEAIIEAGIRAVDERVSLTDMQRKKLRLAGRGDVAQIISRAAELRPRLTSKLLNEQQHFELMKELQPLRIVQQSGIIGEGSLFRKTLRHTLTPDQYQLLERERRSTIVNNALVSVPNIEWGPMSSNKSTPKTRQANRQRFVDELLTHGKLPPTDNVYFRYAVFLEIGRLEDRLKPLVNEDAWSNLQTKVIETRRWEPALRHSERWPANDTDSDAETAPKEGQ